MTINNRFVEIEQTFLTEAKALRPDGTVDTRAASLVKEHVIEVSINEKPALRLVCTPNKLAELILGRAVTEGFIESSDDVESLYICESGNRAKLYLKREPEFGNKEYELPIEPTCCTDNRILGGFYGTKALQPVARTAISKEHVFALINKFSENASLHKKTAGTHSCYLSCMGEYQGVFEDIGRHNALDKAVGHALINGLAFADCMLFTTGRVPVDMARKVIMAGIPALVSKAVPTVDAVEMAKQYHLTLICRAWPDSYEVYNEGN
ncbi:MAG: formate dehydrogenase accessory sulfurtransferase FdhD [Lachnospiraceae bacterium]|nr:formate dehydrogenase accessory sulfurtransferase FdhD [Lachnospiraceae bacterium]